MRAAAPPKPAPTSCAPSFRAAAQAQREADGITAACGERVAPAPEEPGAEPEETPAEAKIEGVVA